MSSFEIKGSRPMKGEITPQGAKNEALQVICAALLTSETITIKNIPDILDVNNLILLLSEMGVTVHRESPNTCSFTASDINYKIDNVRMVCMDLTTPNAAAIKKGQIKFLIGQGPEYQGFYAMKTLLEYLIFKKPVKVVNHMQLDILTRETVDYYKRFSNTLY